MEDDDAAPFHGTQQRADNGAALTLRADNWQFFVIQLLSILCSWMLPEQIGFV